jgi:hypothetical protein
MEAAFATQGGLLGRMHAVPAAAITAHWKLNRWTLNPQLLAAAGAPESTLLQYLTVEYVSWCHVDVLLTHRDPYATFLAEYKRLRTHEYDSCSDGLSDGSQPCKGGHVSVIKKVDFNKPDFRCVAA